MKAKKFLTIQEKNDLMFDYLCTNMKIDDIATKWGIHRSTVFNIIHKFHYVIRKPGAGNFTNHPSTFDRDLREAYNSIQPNQASDLANAFVSNDAEMVEHEDKPKKVSFFSRVKSLFTKKGGH